MSTMDNSIPQNKASQDQITPKVALQMLMDGNARFTNQNTHDRDSKEFIAATGGGQWPFAAVLSCVDSRVPVETVFDQSIGDVFSARVAGNFVNDDILGSLEYAVGVAGSKLIMVLGHTGCGAVKHACLRTELGNITGMLSNIIPAVNEVEKEMETDAENPVFTNKVAASNVSLTIQKMLRRSQIIKGLYDAGTINIVGAMYDVAKGEVKLVD